MKKSFWLNSKIVERLVYCSFFIFLLSSQGCDDNGTGPGNSLLIANFNPGVDPITYGGKLQQWDYGDELEVTTGYYQLENNDAVHGAYAAFVKLAKSGTKRSDDWSGGGLVVVFQDDESGIDVTGYQFLEFDVKVVAGSALNSTRVKLENSQQGPIYVERLLSQYGITFSTEWQTARIPLTDFATLRSTDPDYWRAVDLTSVAKFVTVSVRDNNTPNAQGTLMIDNIRFIK